MVACQKGSAQNLDLIYWLIRNGGAIVEVITSQRPTPKVSASSQRGDMPEKGGRGCDRSKRGRRKTKPASSGRNGRPKTSSSRNQSGRTTLTNDAAFHRERD